MTPASPPPPSAAARAQLADELVRRLVATLRASQLYAQDHPILMKNAEALSTAVQLLHALQPTIVVGVLGDEIIVDDRPLAKAESLNSMIRRMKDIGVERVSIDRGVSPGELIAFVKAFGSMERIAPGATPSLPGLTHIRIGRVQVGERLEKGKADIGNFRRMYQDAVAAAENVWQAATADGQPDASIARTMVDGLANAVAQNRTALLALTTLKNYDNYTFTHMVNVSILTMGQARSLGIDGPLLREFGLAALMHDIGKVRTPLEVLNKPDKLTDEEFAIMKRHTVEGAEMLRGTPDIPTLAPVVAFEHHLRLDGSGYPTGVRRSSLNLCTQLCSIADVYDAMRSQRRYQQAHPSDRILEVLKRSDGQHFDQHLVRRFSQLIGIYPVGNLVRLNTGELALVTAVYAPEPRRPRVRVLTDREGARLERPYEIDLWTDPPAGEERGSSVAAPVDPAEVGIDPLSLL